MEVLILKTLDHPNISRLSELFYMIATDGTPMICLMMEFYNGPNLNYFLNIKRLVIH
jgi:serine/threonine protein kinase